MLKNYIPSSTRILEEHSLVFFFDETGGFAFPCDKNGNVTISELSDCAMENLTDCMAHPERFERFAEIRTERRKIKNPAHGTCVCGSEVYLYNQYMGACECPGCDRWYNLFGQEIMPPEKWEEDDYCEEWG